MVSDKTKINLYENDVKRKVWTMFNTYVSNMVREVLWYEHVWLPVE